MTQDPAECLRLPEGGIQGLLDLIVALYLQNVIIPVYLPPAGSYPALITLPLPQPIGTLAIVANYIGGQLVFRPTTLTGIDLGQFVIEDLRVACALGIGCLVGGTGSGGTTSLSDDAATVDIRVTDMSVAQSPSCLPGDPACSLHPSQECVLIVTIEGQRVP
jgi:hypothetical protein